LKTIEMLDMMKFDKYNALKFSDMPKAQSGREDERVESANLIQKKFQI
jgi:hypothetical protein